MLKNIKPNTAYPRVYSIIHNCDDLQKDLKKTYECPIQNDNYVSLSELLKIIRQINETLFNDQTLLEARIEQKIMNYFGKKSSAILYRYNSDTIELGFTDNYKIKPYKKIVYKIQDKVFKPNNYHPLSQEIYQSIQSELYYLIELAQIFAFFHNQHNEEIRPINSNLKVNISLYNITIYLLNENNNSQRLQIKFSTYEDRFYKNGQPDYLQLIEEKEWELLNKLYIRLKDCPTFYQQEIIESRKKIEAKKYSKK